MIIQYGDMAGLKTRSHETAKVHFRREGASFKDNALMTLAKSVKENKRTSCLKTWKLFIFFIFVKWTIFYRGKVIESNVILLFFHVEIMLVPNFIVFL